MPSRAGTVLSCVVLALAGCKESSDATRPLPAPEPPATAAQAPSRDEPKVVKRPVADDDDKPAQKRPSEPAEPVKDPDTSAPAEPIAQAGTSSGGSPAVPSPAASVPPVAAPSAGCLARCQSSMQSCLSQPVDGGVPGFGNLELCKNALAACQAACQ